MEFVRTGLPGDVDELFWSGKYWYAASKETGLGKAGNKPIAVGCGPTQESAIADMRAALATPAQEGEKE